MSALPFHFDDDGSDSRSDAWWLESDEEGEALGPVIDAQEGPQRTYLESKADVAIYGGQAGSGKTWALVWDPLRWVSYPGFTGVIFRRTFPQITAPGGLWSEAYKWYPQLGGRPNNQDLVWTFGRQDTMIKFAQLQYDKNIYDWQGAQICYLAFDELTHFTEDQWWYLFSRNRSTCGVRPYVRGSCNADAEHWIAPIIQWWWDAETGYPIQERSGVMRYFTRMNEEIIWADDPETLVRRYGHKTKVKSFTFIAASLDDNKILTREDPDYEANLYMLPEIERERLLRGNWKIKPEAGKVFNRGWFKRVGLIPAGGLLCRYWDFAATTVSSKNKEPDYTASVLMKYVNGRFYIIDVEWFREDPAETDKRFLATKERDLAYARADRSQYLLRWEMEGGSAGKRDNHRLVSLLVGLDAHGVSSSGDKFVRSRPLAIQANAGNVSVKEAAWTDHFLSHMHSQPALHDDIHDAAAGAFQTLVREKNRHLGSGALSPERMIKTPSRVIKGSS